MENNWSKQDSIEATKEGWDLYDSTGSVDGDLQIQRNDEQNLLSEDSDAWKIVKGGSESHHIKAMELLKVNNPKEYKRIKST